MMKKIWCHYINLAVFFFPPGKLNGSFSNLLTTANNYRNFFCDFFQQINHLVLSIGMQKCAENW